ncbi:hypothetical protein [Nonomuraea sp. LPB2021202275-12-8]|uniref:hypothetical protein n=1 Tax=Nonomuraea sp. LPB2021202275-12-8 TaxID=3120159 RepID=UPI00300CE7EF
MKPVAVVGPLAPPLTSSDHHASHRGLLLRPEAPAGANRIDAIVVPTTRPTPYLRHAVELSKKLRCPLVALCSGKWTNASQVRAIDHEAEIIAIDVASETALSLPRFRTSSVLPKDFRRGTDTAAKRNLALALARMLGWRRIVFLDDDIEVSAPDDLRRAAGLLDEFDAVGLSIGGFPDNSVVCHAYRAVGGEQDSFVGGGALAVEISRNIAFFPDIYNEDWFYLLESDGLRPLAVTGRVKQATYDPFRNPDRARKEEFGDVLAEGIFWLLDEGRKIDDANQRHWEDFLTRRRRFITGVLRSLPQASVGHEERQRMAEALKASLGRLKRIDPDLCCRYLDAWRADLKAWHDFVQPLPRAGSVREALRVLASPGCPPLNVRIRTQKAAKETPAASSSPARFASVSL